MIFRTVFKSTFQISPKFALLEFWIIFVSGCNSHESRRVLKFGFIRHKNRDTRHSNELSLHAGHHYHDRRHRRPKQQYPQNHIQSWVARRRRGRRRGRGRRRRRRGLGLQRRRSRLLSIHRRHGGGRWLANMGVNGKFV